MTALEDIKAANIAACMEMLRAGYSPAHVIDAGYGHAAMLEARKRLQEEEGA